jgi:hypothetical protein
MLKTQAGSSRDRERIPVFRASASPSERDIDSTMDVRWLYWISGTQLDVSRGGRSRKQSAPPTYGTGPRDKDFSFFQFRNRANGDGAQGRESAPPRPAAQVGHDYADRAKAAARCGPPTRQCREWLITIVAPDTSRRLFRAGEAPKRSIQLAEKWGVPRHRTRFAASWFDSPERTIGATREFSASLASWETPVAAWLRRPGRLRSRLHPRPWRGR